MDVLLVAVSAIIIIALIVALVIHSRKKAKKSDLTISSAPAPEHWHESEIAIPLEQLPATSIIDEKSLFEITDRTVIARITQTFPAIAETATRTAANHALKSMEVYKAIIPSGATLTKSRKMKGAVRGFFRGPEDIKGHANFVKADLSKSTAIANGVANVMNVGSLIVGQYYMSEINSKLETMSDNINKIGDFQDREFKSRILSLIPRVEEISQFSTEILENADQRNIKLAALENLKGTVSELLGQVNITINDICKKSPNPVYKEYREKVDDFHLLVEYQNVLMSALEEISKLTYLLGKGDTSSDMSYSIFNKFLKQSIQTRNTLEEWHDKQVKALDIDLDKNRISKSGVEGFFSAIPALLDEKWKYKELKQGLAYKINTQSQTTYKVLSSPGEAHNEDVQIIIKNGKYYYLHEPLIAE